MKLKKIIEFFTDEVNDNDENERVEERKELKEQIIKERQKYSQPVEQKVVEENFVTEPVKKQVLFVDETFEKPEKKEVQVQVEDKAPVKYNNESEKKFSPSKYISPVHGLIKEAEEVKEFQLEKKTKSESDFVKIRSKAFGDSEKVADAEDVKNDSSFINKVIEDTVVYDRPTLEEESTIEKIVEETVVFDEPLLLVEEKEKEVVSESLTLDNIAEDDVKSNTDFRVFKTSEIINIKKRIANESEKEVSFDDVITEGEDAQYLFDLLDELNEGKDDE